MHVCEYLVASRSETSRLDNVQVIELTHTNDVGHAHTYLNVLKLIHKYIYTYIQNLHTRIHTCIHTHEYTHTGLTYYTIEYESKSSRGDKHFLVHVTIVDKKLYALTAQVTARATYQSLYILHEFLYLYFLHAHGRSAAILEAPCDVVPPGTVIQATR
jgi:hypothetical protein